MESYKIALVGKMRSGKDTVADILSEKVPTSKLAFADGITEVIRLFFPSQYWSESKPREHYQKIGQTFRELDKNIWVNLLATRVKATSIPTGVSMIITDVRQQNEAEWCRENGFTLVKVESLDTLRAARVFKSDKRFNSKEFYHETELAVDSIEADYTITNNGTLEELEEQVGEVLNKIKDDSQLKATKHTEDELV